TITGFYLSKAQKGKLPFNKPFIAKYPCCSYGAKIRELPPGTESAATIPSSRQIQYIFIHQGIVHPPVEGSVLILGNRTIRSQTTGRLDVLQQCVADKAASLDDLIRGVVFLERHPRQGRDRALPYCKPVVCLWFNDP